MACTPTVAMALASHMTNAGSPGLHAAAEMPANSRDKPGVAALPTPPNSISPELAAHRVYASVQSPPPINIEHEVEMQEAGEQNDHDIGPEMESLPDEPSGMPLSRGALSGLDASAAITPAMLAKHHLPGIMLGNGPRPIRYVMGELTQSVPGFSRIPPAKARRLVVAALESRHGGGPDGNVAFCKTGWGRWDAHIKGSSKDSGVGSFHSGNASPPRSERSSYAVSNGDSGVHMPRPSGGYYRDQHSGGSWTASSLREEDELELELDAMDMPEMEADKMSLDGVSEEDNSDNDSSSSDLSNDDTDDEDWTAIGADALRKASLPTPGAPRINYNALSIPGRGPSRGWSRRPSGGGYSQRPSLHSASVPFPRHSSFGRPTASPGLNPALATPEEKAAVAALLSLGSM